MAGNNNSKVKVSNDTMIAEILISEVDKLTSHYNKVIESNQRIDSNYQEIKILLSKQQNVINSFSEFVKENNKFIEEYKTLTTSAVNTSEQLIKVQTEGVSLNEDGLRKVCGIVSKGYSPINQYMKLLLYAIGAAFVLLFVVAIFI